MIEANSLIENLGDHLQWRARSRIALTDSRANELLSAALAALDSNPEFTVRSFPLRTATTRRRWWCISIPIRRSAHDIFAGSYALLVLTPVAAPAAPPVD